MNWDEYFLSLVYACSKKSKDKHTQVGCVIVGQDHEIRSMGYNSFPRGIDDNVPERYERPEKYYWMEHAERNAVYNAARMGTALKDCILYCQWIPCVDCARASIQVGIKEIVVDKTQEKKWHSSSKWKDSEERSIQMINEAGILLRYINDKS